jgi:hypothetical protein
MELRSTSPGALHGNRRQDFAGPWLGSRDGTQSDMASLGSAANVTGKKDVVFGAERRLRFKTTEDIVVNSTRASTRTL